MSELKKCPFCGGEAEFYRTPIKSNGGWCDSVVVRCKECEARTNRVLYNSVKHPNDEEYMEAAEAWNRRAPLDHIIERLEESMPQGIELSHERYLQYLALDKAIEIIKEEVG